jgi:ABC-type dipeptide/oligopeptide/nickel transport system permease subunit
VSGAFLLLVVLAVWAGTPLLSLALGHGPNDPFPYAVSETTLSPVGPWSHVPDQHVFTGERPQAETALLVLGADGQLGRDLLLRLLDGGKVTLMVALGATLLALAIGVLVGLAAAWFGGFVDAAISRATELVMAFPLLFFVILLASTVGDHVDGVTLGFLRPGVLSLVLVIGSFTWFYPARIVRTEVLALRGRDFVEAARMIGASDARILRSHLLPHLVPTMIVYTTLLFATNVLLEAGISFLGFGIKLPTASWGSLLSTSWGAARSTTTGPLSVNPWLTLAPSLTIFAVVLALNLLGEGLRTAIDPVGSRR